MVARMHQKILEQGLARFGERKSVAPLILREALAQDKAAADEVVERGGQARFVASAGASERGLRQPGVLVDQGEDREAAGTQVDLVDVARKPLERGFLRQAQVKADRVRQRSEAKLSVPLRRRVGGR